MSETSESRTRLFATKRLQLTLLGILSFIMIIVIGAVMLIDVGGRQSDVRRMQSETVVNAPTPDFATSNLLHQSLDLGYLTTATPPPTGLPEKTTYHIASVRIQTALVSRAA